ncbi:MAG: anaerobic ribonucleoside-triphosphate reductase activating protein [Verrucomicrobiales bacterium]|nr:anaerobic ribonucleoside-triphosphate reductase activating protein [Verrucomicrobiales bacterium]
MLPALKVAGLTALTTIDFPGQLAAVVFCQGCPWRCPYCHNPNLLPNTGSDSLPWQQVTSFMNDRRGLLDGIVFSGGEPTSQTALLQAILEMKQLGFSVGLHTAGPYPDRLSKVLAHLDWIALDIKAPFDSYDKITGALHSGEKAKQSALLILESGLPYEFRTTVHPNLIDERSLLILARNLQQMGVENFALQDFRPTSALPKVEEPLSAHVIKAIGAMFPQFLVR